MVIAAGALIDAADFPVDQGWTSAGIVAGAGVSLNAVAYRVDTWGNVQWRGIPYRTTQPAQNDVMFTFPAAIAPTYRGAWSLGGLGGMAAIYFVGLYGASGSSTAVSFRNLVGGSSWPGGSQSLFCPDLAGMSWSIK